MKDEANGSPIIEFCGLRSKMYCYLKEDDNNLSVAPKLRVFKPKIKQF